MKKALSLALVVLLVVSAFAVFTFSASADETWEWKVEGDKLTLSGTGATTDYRGNEDGRPWADKLADITEIVVEDGITAVGSSSFTRMTAVKKITFGKDVTKLGMDVASYDTALEEVIFNGPITEIGQGILFGSADSIKTVTITGQTEEEFKAIAAQKNYNIDGVPEGWNGFALSKATYIVNAAADEAVLLGGYKWNDPFQYIKGKYVYPYDFDIGDGSFTSKVLVDAGDSIDYTVTLTPETGDPITKTTKQILTMTWSDTDNALFFDLTPFGLKGGEKFIKEKVEFVYDGVKYYTEKSDEGTVPTITPITSDLSGTFEGTDVTWKIDAATKTLTIDGTGAMPDFEHSGDAPWADYKPSIQALVVKGGVTKVGKNTASNSGIGTATFEEGVQEVGFDACAYSLGLETVYLPKTLVKLAQGTVYSSDQIKAANYAGSEEDWKNVTIGDYNSNITKHLVYNVPVPTEQTPVDPTPVEPGPAGEYTVVLVVLAVVALFGTALVTKKVFGK